MRSITFFLSFIPILALVLLILNLVFAPHSPYQEKSSTFECGFHSFLGQNRTQFSISFFIYALLFLLFDLELLLIYPYVVSSYDNSGYGLVIMLIFFFILTVGFAFELGKKALSIESKQINNNSLAELIFKQGNLLFTMLGFLIYNKSKLLNLIYNIVRSHLKHKFVKLIYDIVRNYFTNLCLVKLIVKALKKRIYLILMAFTLDSLGIISYKLFFYILPVVLISIILYMFINSLGRKIKIVTLIIYLTFNIAIATIFIYSLFFVLSLAMPLSILNPDNLESILPFVSIFTCLGFETFTDEIIYITGGDTEPNGPGEPGDNGPGEPGDNGPGGPGDNGPGGFGGGAPEGSTNPKKRRTKKKALSREVAEKRNFANRWKGSTADGKGLYSRLCKIYAADSNWRLDESQKKFLKKAFTDYYPEETKIIEERDPVFSIIVSGIREGNTGLLQDKEILKQITNVLNEIVNAKPK